MVLLKVDGYIQENFVKFVESRQQPASFFLNI